MEIENLIKRFTEGSLSEDQIIASIVSQSKYVDSRGYDSVVRAWRLLAKTGKLSADKAYDVGCIAADSEVWSTFFLSSLFPADELIEYAMFASQKKDERNNHVDIWRAVAASIDIKLLSIDQMFYIAERARSEEFTTNVLTSGRLSVEDVLTRGLEIFFQISSYIQEFHKFLTKHFNAEFWDKEECLAALKKSKRVGAFAWVVGNVPLLKGDMDQIIMLARAIETKENRLVDECVVSPVIMKNQHSISEVFALINNLDETSDSRLAILATKGEELSCEQILDLVLRVPTTKEILQQARLIFAKRNSV